MALDHEAASARRGRLIWAGRILTGIAALASFIWLCLPSSIYTAQAKHKPAHKRIPVYYWHMWGAEWLPVMNHVCDEFNASQNKYEVIPLQIPRAEGDQKFLLSVAGGSPPDVMAQWTPAISAWAQSGILQPLDMRMTPQEERFFENDTYPAVHDNGLYKGHLYGLNLSYDVYACYYRPDQWRQAGLDPDHFPATLESLSAAGNKLTQVDSSGRITRLGFLPQMFARYVPSFGGQFYDPATHQVALDTPQQENALAYVVAQHKQIGFNRMIQFTAGLGSEQGATWPFITGQQAVVLDGEWRVLQMKKYAPGIDYRVSPLPPASTGGGVPLASYSANTYLTIPTGARHPDGAWAFIKFWSGLDNPAASAQFAVSFGWLPTSPQMANSPDYRKFLAENPQYKTFVQLAGSPHIVSLPPVPYSVYLQDKLTSDDDLAERGALSATAALALLKSQMAEEARQRRELGYDQ